jgi:hypothetical protein
MRARKRHILRWIAVAFAATAVTAPAAQAVGPDDRAFSRQSPVDVWNHDLRTGEQPAEIPYLSHGVGVGEDDLGLTMHPDSRPFARSVGDISPSVSPVAVVQARGFDWGDAVIGGIFGVGFALLGAGAILTAHRRRGTPTTA